MLGSSVIRIKKEDKSEMEVMYMFGYNILVNYMETRKTDDNFRCCLAGEG